MPFTSFPAIRMVQLAPLLTGLLAHLVFNRLEPRKPVIWLIMLFGLPTALTVIDFDCCFRIGYIVTSNLLHLSALLTSLVLYRTSPFHPLSKYPGPWTARISALYTTIMAISRKRHVKMMDLHRKYGTHVRIGPNILSIVHVDAIKTCLGTHGMPKAALAYISESQPFHIVATSSIRATNHGFEHAKRRKIWNRTFTGPALKEYDINIEHRTALLVKRLEEQEETVDLSSWISFFTFDFMGDIVFGGGFEMLRDGGDLKGLWRILLSSVHALNVVVTLDWIGNILPYIPKSEGYKRLEKFAEERVAIRTQRGTTLKDLFYCLTENEDGKDIPVITSRKTLVDDIFIGIIGGADTTASVLANILNEFGAEDPIDASRLAKLPYLNAVIHETLRLYPAVPFNIARTPETGSGGEIVAGRFVPEGTDIYLPPYVYHRDPRYFFPDPEQFRPERWINDSASSNSSSQKLNLDAFIPFSYGPANCVGKHLAYREMRVVISRLIHNFDMEFAKGYNTVDWLEELKDDSVFAKGRLPVRLTIRK